MRVGRGFWVISWCVLGLATPSCSGADESEDETLTGRQQRNVDACQSMQDALAEQACDSAWTISSCDIQEGVSGDCVPFFQCLEDAGCDVQAQGGCDEPDVMGSCGDPG